MFFSNEDDRISWYLIALAIIVAAVPSVIAGIWIGQHL